MALRNPSVRARITPHTEYRGAGGIGLLYGNDRLIIDGGGLSKKRGTYVRAWYMCAVFPLSLSPSYKSRNQIKRDLKKELWIKGPVRSRQRTKAE